MFLKSNPLIVATILVPLSTLFLVNISNPLEVKAATEWSEEYDATEGKLHNVAVENSEAGYFGNGYIASWNGNGQFVQLEVSVPSAGAYTFVFNYSAAAGSATRYLSVNSEVVIEEVRFSGTGSWGDWQTTYVKDVYLTSGVNTITLGFDSAKGSTNWLNYDSLIVKEPSEKQSVEWDLKEEAELAQQSLEDNFWDNETSMFRNQYPDDEENNRFHYWWLAHGIDTLMDGYERTGNSQYIDKATALYAAVKERNGGDIRNDFYDDMLWMALALQRLHQFTNDPEHEQAVFTLWEDIKTGWSNEYGGGIAWNKSQLDYKNTPSNAPAVILATRLYQNYGNDEDLQWAKKIYNWLTDTLVDPTNGFVWDGINRTGDGKIDKEWEFTYNQGVYIGASVELYQVTGEEKYLNSAVRTANTAKNIFSNHNHIIYEGGSGDGGLFKGILVRYVTDLVKVDPSQEQLAQWIVDNAKNVWKKVESDPEILFGSSWEGKNRLPIELSQQLSGVMLMEHAAQLEPIILKQTTSSLEEHISNYQENNQLDKVLAKKLGNQVKQANDHLDKGRLKQAVNHLELFKKHLEKGLDKGAITNKVYKAIQEILNKSL